MYSVTKKIISKTYRTERLRLLSHGPLCGRATSVPTTHTQVVSQATRSSNITGHARISKMNIFTSNILLLFIFGTAVAPMNALRGRCVTPVAEPQESGPAVGWNEEPLLG